MSAYLQPADYFAYGAPSATGPQVMAASAVIDAYLRRPEGLVWVPDANGNPAYMAGLPPMYTLTGSAIAAGAAVQVTVTGPALSVVVGSVAVLDKSNAAAIEAVQVTAVNGNVLTLANVQFAHAAGFTLDFGTSIVEQKQMPDSRPITNLSRWPVVRLLAGEGRYGYGRQGAQSTSDLNQFNLLAAMTMFGGPPVWEQFDVTNAGIDPQTGQLWTPAGIMLAYYTEVRVHYVAGWTYANLPVAIKQACSNIIQAQTNSPLNGNIQTMKAGDTTITRFADTALDADTRNMLNPFSARMYG